MKSSLSNAGVIISASRRTDIPAFYTDWFIKRLREGYVDVSNPFNKRQTRRVSLGRNDVGFFVFWTRDAGDFLRNIEAVDSFGIPYYFNYTITGYGKGYEPNCRNVQESIETFKKLSAQIGRDRVVWRYDPIIIGHRFSYDWHETNVAFLMRELSGFTNRVIISFADKYAKNKRFWEEEKVLDFARAPELYIGIAKFISDSGGQYGIKAQSCCETDLSEDVAVRGACIDPKIIFVENRQWEKDAYQREGCLCAKSTDIGAYNTCFFGCKYCYATGKKPQTLISHSIREPVELLYARIF
jgi:hypothetical protein